MTYAKKGVLIVSCSLLLLIALVVGFISPLTKYAIEKYDEKYTGRQITMDWLYLNPFTGFLHVSNFKVYELNSDSVFISTDGLTLNLSMLKLFTGNYELSECILDRPL